MKKILCCLALSLCVLAASALPSSANSAVTGRFGTSGGGSGGSGGSVGSGAKSVLGVKFGMLFGGDLDSGWGAGAFYHRKIGIISLQPELILHIYDSGIYDSYYPETEGHSDLALNLLLGLSLGSPASFCLNPYAGLGFDVIDGDLMIPVGGRYTIDARQAKEYVDLLMPDVVIPMHYMMDGYRTEFDELDEFLDLFDQKDIEYVDTDEVEFDRTDFDGERTRVMVFKKIH